MPPFSQALVNITLQEVDLQTAGLPIPINRSVPQLLVPASTELSYRGYVQVTNTNLILATGLTAANPVLFFFCRNLTANQGGLNVTLTPTAGVAFTVNLAQGGMILEGNPSNPYGAANSLLGFTSIVLVTSGASVAIAEVMLAY
jgi:hypothetical protein